MTLGSVVIGGGSGFIGSALCRKLRILGYEVLSISRKPGLDSLSWNELEKQGLPENCSAVINVAGQNVLDPTRRWTSGFQQNVFASRVRTTAFLAQLIERMKNPPKVFCTITGVGYYKYSETATYTEESPGGDHDYFSRLVKAWEDSSVLPPELNVRRFVVRSGVVLGRSGGLISQVFWPFFLGLGGPIGSGKQFFPWIHVEDLAGIFAHGLATPTVRGVYNGVAPQVVTNAEFARALASALRRPALVPLPEPLLRLAFGPERASMMVEGQRVLPQRTLQSGYRYVFPDIREACRDCARIFVDERP